jgi:hypothetical protein
MYVSGFNNKILYFVHIACLCVLSLLKQPNIILLHVLMDLIFLKKEQRVYCAVGIQLLNTFHCSEICFIHG